MAIEAAADAGPGRGPRLAVIDLVRGAAIAAMVVYHAAYDLSVERLIAANVGEDRGWVVFARLIAGTFLLLVGVNLVLATRRGFRRTPFLRRLAIVVAAAGLVTLATWWAVPDGFVFFGILHQIALASVLALPFLRLPSGAVALVAVAVIAAPVFFRHPLFDAWPLLWVGFTAEPPDTIDYVPLFPWFGVVLAGIVVGRLIASRVTGTVADWRPRARFARLVTAAGRWSLAIYLIHQPVLLALLWIAQPLLASGETVARRHFMEDCVAVCRTEGRDEATCTAFCTCMFDGLYATDLYAARSLQLLTPEQRGRWDATVASCAPASPAP